VPRAEARDEWRRPTGRGSPGYADEARRDDPDERARPRYREGADVADEDADGADNDRWRDDGIESARGWWPSFDERATIQILAGAIAALLIALVGLVAFYFFAIDAGGQPRHRRAMRSKRRRDRSCDSRSTAARPSSRRRPIRCASSARAAMASIVSKRARRQAIVGPGLGDGGAHRLHALRLPSRHQPLRSVQALQCAPTRPATTCSTGRDPTIFDADSRRTRSDSDVESATAAVSLALGGCTGRAGHSLLRRPRPGYPVRFVSAVALCRLAHLEDRRQARPASRRSSAPASPPASPATACASRCVPNPSGSSRYHVASRR
jgi:hypothetical protein